MARTPITLLKTAVRIAQESPFQRVARMRRGSTTRDLQSLAGCLGLDTKEIHRMLGIPRRRRGTDHAVGKHPVLSLGETERVVGLWQLIGQVQALATPSTPAHSSSVARGFGAWLASPAEILGKPVSHFLDTFEGCGLILDHMQAAYGYTDFNRI